MPTIPLETSPSPRRTQLKWANKVMVNSTWGEYGCGAKTTARNGTLVNENMDSICSPIPGGLMLTHIVGTIHTPDLAARRHQGEAIQAPLPEAERYLHSPRWPWVKTNGIPFWGVRCTTHFRTYFSGDWDVRWGFDLGFDPWPHGEVRAPCLGEPSGELPKSGKRRDWGTGLSTAKAQRGSKQNHKGH